MTHKPAFAILAFALATLSAPIWASSGFDNAVRTSEAYRFSHADQRWRHEGEAAYAQRNPRSAMEYFQRAARYADKPSQALVAAMLWEGDGVPRDRALAYAWADLAAERGYPRFVATREKYWSALDAAERKRAVEAGQAVYDEYGDSVAKPRLAQELARERRDKTTGSRLGNAGPANIKLFDQATGKVVTIPGLIYNDPRFWDPAEHWQAVDAAFSVPAGG